MWGLEDIFACYHESFFAACDVKQKFQNFKKETFL